MPILNLTDGERTAIAEAISSISVAQSNRQQPLQILPNDTENILMLGVSSSIVAAAQPAGFTFRIDELKDNSGPIGWRLYIQLNRDETMWQFIYEKISGVSTQYDWHEITESLPWL